MHGTDLMFKSVKLSEGLDDDAPEKWLEEVERLLDEVENLLSLEVKVEAKENGGVS